MREHIKRERLLFALAAAGLVLAAVASTMY